MEGREVALRGSQVKRPHKPVARGAYIRLPPVKPA